MSTYQIDAPAGAIYADNSLISAWRAGASRAAKWVLQAFVQALAEYRTKQAVRELQQLDDRMLRDIGIDRDAIDYAVRHGRELDVAPFAREWASWGVGDPK